MSLSQSASQGSPSWSLSASSACVVRLVQVMDGAQARKHQHGDLRVAGFVDGGADQVELGGEREAVVERGTAQAVAVADLDDGDLGVVEGADHGADVVFSEPVAHGVGAVAQRGVRESDAQVL